MNIDDVLKDEQVFVHGWKAIGAVLGKSGRTARRWYDTRGLPVRYGVNGRPLGIKHELVRWMLLVHENLEKMPERKQRLREHAAMMRSRKSKFHERKQIKA
ncbi:MAG TPA: hypothetical protein PLO63_16925 [Syntrophales bacterium]|nr:hypothetical protein [Syntrophales bacterium]